MAQLDVLNKSILASFITSQTVSDVQNHFIYLDMSMSNVFKLVRQTIFAYKLYVHR